MENRIVRFLISGGSAAAVDLIFLYFFTDVLHIWYVLGTILAFCIAFIVSFMLQKYWTFLNHDHDMIPTQLTYYFCISLINLGLNTVLVYFFVDKVGQHYLVAQILTSGILAIESYFIYKHFIFKTVHVREQ